jgi:hypothetical protein
MMNLGQKGKLRQVKRRATHYLNQKKWGFNPLRKSRSQMKNRYLDFQERNWGYRELKKSLCGK